MNKKTLGLIILISLTASGWAQILISKPYLKITNSLSGQVYKIKPNKKIEFIPKDDSVLKKERIAYFVDTNLIVFSNGNQIRLDQISYIRFTPKSKGLRITKLLLYGFWGAASALLIYENTNPGHDPNFQPIPLGPMFFAGTVFTIAIAEIGESMFNVFIQKRELYKNKNLKLEIVNR